MSLTEQLRAAIAASGKTHYRLWQESGVAPHVIDRFVSGERSLNLATADKLAATLGLALTVITEHAASR
jgi:plasmid maintenance system antidote protein VapI